MELTKLDIVAIRLFLVHHVSAVGLSLDMPRSVLFYFPVLIFMNACLTMVRRPKHIAFIM